MWKSKRPSNIKIDTKGSPKETEAIGFTFNPLVRNLKIKESEKSCDKDFFFFSKNVDLESCYETPTRTTLTSNSLQDAPKKTYPKSRFFF